MVLPLSLLAAAGALVTRASTLSGALLALALVVVALLAAINRLTHDPIEVDVPPETRGRAAGPATSTGGRGRPRPQGRTR